VTLAAGSPLVGAPLGSLEAAVVAVRGAEGIETIPPDDRRLGAEDPLYVVARPDRLRKMGAAASGEEVAVSSGVPPDG
jgi:Trk K+ transport system NAD-binding subunit